jgi:hypothetical protein
VIHRRQPKLNSFTARPRERNTVPQAKGGHGRKGSIEKQSREEKTKAEKNKKKSAPVPSGFERVRMIGKDASGKKFS